MENQTWLRQGPDTPLFPDLLWSRPENRAFAGKLLVVGGNAQGFAAAAEGYQLPTAAGIGTVRVLLPDVLQKTVGRIFEAGEYAPSTPSGSFAKNSLAPLLDMAAWADGVLLAGDFGRNSETAIVLETLLEKYHEQLTITRDAADYFISNPVKLLSRPKTSLVISFAQLQKLAISAHYDKAFTFDMDFLRLVALLEDFTADNAVNVIVRHLDNIFVATQGKVSASKTDIKSKIWRLATAAHAATWWLQNPTKTFESLTSGVYDYLAGENKKA